MFIPIPSLDSLSIGVVIASDYHKEISDFAFTGLSTNRERFQSTEYHRSFTDHANEQHGTPQSMFLFTNGILSLTHTAWYVIVLVSRKKENSYRIVIPKRYFQRF